MGDGVANLEFDLFRRVKRDECVSLIGHVTMIYSPHENTKLVPAFCYDKLELFDSPFLTTYESQDFRINLPLRKGIKDPQINHFLFLFFLKGVAIEVANWWVPTDESRVDYFSGARWFQWGNPRPDGFPPPPFGWGDTEEEAIKDFSVQIYA